MLGRTLEIFGLLGRKLGHSWSVPIHAALGNGAYRLLELEPDGLAPFLHRKDIGGLNVTIPYKRDVMPLCDEIDPAAEAIGSVNTIVRCADGKLVGYVLINASENAGIYTSLISGGVPLEGLQGDLMDRPNLFWFPKETRITKLRGGVQL